jgi:hypothetical protein
MADTLDLIIAVCLGIGVLALLVVIGLALVSLIQFHRTHHSPTYRVVRLPEDQP